MTNKPTHMSQVSASVLKRTREFLEGELGIAVKKVEGEAHGIDQLTLNDITIIVAVGGHINLLIAMSFVQSLVEAIYVRLTADIEVPAGEEHQYRCEAVAETVNTILGHCTQDLQNPKYRITLTPPVVLEEAKRLHRTKDAMFHCQRMETDFGTININFIGPRELFTAELNYVK